MPTFIISAPTDTIQLHVLSNLLTGLEELFAIETSSAIVITTGDPRLEPLLQSLAAHVIPDPAPNPAEAVGADGIRPTDPDDIAPEVDTENAAPPVPDLQPSPVIIWNNGHHSDAAEHQDIPSDPTEKLCPICQSPVPAARRSPFCSDKCYMKDYWARKKTAPRKPKGDPRSGDGIVKGTIARR